MNFTSPITISAGKTVALYGDPNKPPVVISGGGTSRLFRVAAGATLMLSNILIRDGSSTGGSGCECDTSTAFAGCGGAIMLEGNFSEIESGTSVTECTLGATASLYTQQVTFEGNFATVIASSHRGSR